MPGFSQSSLLNAYANDSKCTGIVSKLATVRLLYSIYRSTESAHEGSPVLLALSPQRSGGKPRELHEKIALGLFIDNKYT